MAERTVEVPVSLLNRALGHLVGPSLGDDPVAIAGDPEKIAKAEDYLKVVSEIDKLLEPFQPIEPPRNEPLRNVGTAVLSHDGVYRYELRRTWGNEDGPLVCWVMLNPSTADADNDDPTIRRCISFSNRWGFDRLVVVNLFALRATDPKELKLASEPVGSANDATILAAALESEQVIAAWGAHGTHLNRAAKVTQLLTGTADPLALWCLGITNKGAPRHPLYVPGEQMRLSYRSLVTREGQYL